MASPVGGSERSSRKAARVCEERARFYTVLDGRRHVVPYQHTFTSFSKRRWLGRRVLDVMREEFPAQCTEAYLDEAMRCGRLTLNGRSVDYQTIFRPGDRLEHTVQREEPGLSFSCICIARTWVSQ